MTNEDFSVEQHDALSHLSADQEEELYQRYLSGEKILALLKEYEISSIANYELIKVLTPKILGDKCRHCHHPLLLKRLTKDKFGSFGGNKYAYCSSCEHKPELGTIGEVEEAYFCYCQACAIEREYNHAVVFKEQTYEPHDSTFNISIEHLTDEQLFNLGMYLPAFSESKFTVPPGEGARWCKVLSIINNLHRDEVIVLSRQSNPDSLYLAPDEGGGLSASVNLLRCTFLLNITVNAQCSERASIEDVIRRLQMQLQVSKQTQKNFLRYIWRYELNSIFEGTLEYLWREGAELPRGQTLNEAIQNIPASFSVQEAVCIINSVIRSAREFYKTGKAQSYRHALNCIPSYLTRYISKIEEGVFQRRTIDSYYISEPAEKGLRLLLTAINKEKPELTKEILSKIAIDDLVLNDSSG